MCIRQLGTWWAVLNGKKKEKENAWGKVLSLAFQKSESSQWFYNMKTLIEISEWQLKTQEKWDDYTIENKCKL